MSKTLLTATALSSVFFISLAQSDSAFGADITPNTTPNPAANELLRPSQVTPDIGRFFKRSISGADAAPSAEASGERPSRPTVADWFAGTGAPSRGDMNRLLGRSVDGDFKAVPTDSKPSIPSIPDMFDRSRSRDRFDLNGLFGRSTDSGSANSKPQTGGPAIPALPDRLERRRIAPEFDMSRFFKGPTDTASTPRQPSGSVAPGKAPITPDAFSNNPFRSILEMATRMPGRPRNDAGDSALPYDEFRERETDIGQALPKPDGKSPGGGPGRSQFADDDKIGTIGEDARDIVTTVPGGMHDDVRTILPDGGSRGASGTGNSIDPAAQGGYDFVSGYAGLSRERDGSLSFVVDYKDPEGGSHTGSINLEAVHDAPGLYNGGGGTGDFAGSDPTTGYFEVSDLGNGVQQVAELRGQGADAVTVTYTMDSFGRLLVVSFRQGGFTSHFFVDSDGSAEYFELASVEDFRRAAELQQQQQQQQQQESNDRRKTEDESRQGEGEEEPEEDTETDESETSDNDEGSDDADDGSGDDSAEGDGEETEQTEADTAEDDDGETSSGNCQTMDCACDPSEPDCNTVSTGDGMQQFLEDSGILQNGEVWQAITVIGGAAPTFTPLDQVTNPSPNGDGEGTLVSGQPGTEEEPDEFVTGLLGEPEEETDCRTADCNSFDDQSFAPASGYAMEVLFEALPQVVNPPPTP